ncbi:chemotaxis protein CheYIII [alpha proteobacterium U9-1i]|nr:chemotaxis protein CheYIII [alpha proteobacterium U9-1i]
MSQDDIFDPSELTALVLDRNHYERGISLDLLRGMGFKRAVGAADVHEAWDQLLTLNPSVVLVEWLKDGPDPLDFVRRVRLSEEAPNRAVSTFMLTTRGFRADVEAARSAGVNGYLRKPISALALQQHVRVVMSNPQPFIVTSTYVGPCRRRRLDPAFAGPWRRLDDEAAGPSITDDEEIDLKTQLARARVAALDAAARDFQPGDARAARGVFAAAQDLLKVAEQIGDHNLILGTKEMMRYLQAQGATARLDPDVVRTHVAALHQLVHLPHALGQERESVALSLKRMVDKKLRQAHAA